MSPNEWTSRDAIDKEIDSPSVLFRDHEVTAPRYLYAWTEPSRRVAAGSTYGMGVIAVEATRSAEADCVQYFPHAFNVWFGVGAERLIRYLVPYDPLDD